MFVIRPFRPFRSFRAFRDGGMIEGEWLARVGARVARRQLHDRKIG
jgi:hypothetical protein